MASANMAYTTKANPGPKPQFLFLAINMVNDTPPTIVDERPIKLRYTAAVTTPNDPKAKARNAVRSARGMSQEITLVIELHQTWVRISEVSLKPLKLETNYQTR